MLAVCSRQINTFDSTYHVDLRAANENNCLITHPMYTDEVNDCVYEIPGFSPIVVPGLAEKVFHTPVVSLYTAGGSLTPILCLRLPAIHVLLNQALKASNLGIPYNWEAFRSSLSSEMLSMLGQVINTKASRAKEGDGFMALAQANPNQPQDTLGIGYELAVDLARMCRFKDKNFAIRDLNGLLVRTSIRYPATRSSGVKRWMKLRVVGRGRCCQLHPIVLKEHMLGDVDGDGIFNETDSLLRHAEYDPFVSIEIPSVVSKIDGTVTSADIYAQPYDKKTIAMGLAGKEAIGIITNMCYRVIVLAHKSYQDTEELRKEFFVYCDRLDLLEKVEKQESEEKKQKMFRYLSAEVVIDCFSPLYEACFDARKDIKLMEYVDHVLDAVRDPKNLPLDFAFLGAMEWNGEIIDVRALELIWKSCDGAFVKEVSSMPVQALFFDGKSDNARRRTRLKQIISMGFKAKEIWAGINNEEMIVAPEQAAVPEEF